MLSDTDRIKDCLGLIDIMIEICDFFVEQVCIDKFEKLRVSLEEGIETLLIESSKFEREDSSIQYFSTVENIQYSWQKAVKRNSIEIIEFETVPLIQEYKYLLYFWGTVYPDKTRIDNFMKNEVHQYCGNKYYDLYEKKNQFLYELSISVLAYNNLEYTQQCVKSILKTIPANIDCELILINHGSTDETQLYFESLETGYIRKKIIHCFRNNGNYSVLRRIIEGRFHITFSNDVIALPHAIENMLKLAQSDDKAAFIVPSTSAVSNLQTLDVSYNSLEEAIEFANYNNIYNEFKHEQRTRLCNPATMTPSKYAFSKWDGIFAGAYQYTSEFRAFGDDKISLLYRRNGLKCILQKDAYCHHFGSVTMKSETKIAKEVEFYNKGRVLFKEEFGIDPWGVGFCYDYNLIKFLNCDEDYTVNVLGINCGIGSNPLKIREFLKEEMHNPKVKIYNLTDDDSYFQDLAGVSDYVLNVESEKDILNAFNKEKFNYIIFESNMKKYQMCKLAEKLKSKLTIGGRLCILNTEFKDAEKVGSSLYEGWTWYVYRAIIS